MFGQRSAAPLKVPPGACGTQAPPCYATGCRYIFFFRITTEDVDIN